MTNPTTNTADTHLNRQIAERLGWTCGSTPASGHIVYKTDDLDEQGTICPNWTADRNAIATDLLPRLTDEQWAQFTGRLALNWFDTCDASFGSVVRHAVASTPTQICRAWLEATKETK